MHIFGRAIVPQKVTNGGMASCVRGGREARQAHGGLTKKAGPVDEQESDGLKRGLYGVCDVG